MRPLGKEKFQGMVYRASHFQISPSGSGAKDGRNEITEEVIWRHPEHRSYAAEMDLR